MLMDNHEKKPAVVERLTNQLQRRRIIKQHTRWHGGKGALENFGSTGRHVHERQEGEATLQSTREMNTVCIEPQA
jgi:hypothetical protein